MVYRCFRKLIKILLFYVRNFEAFSFCFAGEYLNIKVSVYY